MMTETKPKRQRTVTSSKTRTRDDQVIDRRRSLLKAAIKVISKRGLTGVTINSIAAEAKCSYGVVAFHFQSKEGIIFAALDYSAAEYESYLTRLNSSERGPAERIRHMIDTDFSRKAAGTDAIALWLAFWAEAARVPSFRKRCGELRTHYNNAVIADVKALAEMRGITVDAERIGMSLNAMISGLWIENLLLPLSVAEGQKRGHDACLAFMRAYFPEDFQA
jgi:TetR/AcrR family transcriptional regulator, transcriptional repressor of bet genes